MSLSNPRGFTEPGFESGGGPRASSRSVKIINFLTVTLWLLHITYWLVVGGFLILFPLHPFWSRNPLIYRFPNLEPVIANPFLRGAVLGLGIVNLIIGIQEIVRLQRDLENHLSR
jgi:hypothetical protein